MTVGRAGGGWVGRAFVIGVTAILMAAFASCASALTFRVGGASAGPVLAGRSVAWADGSAVFLRRGGGVRRVARFLTQDPNDDLEIRLAASPRWLAYEVDESEPMHGDSLPVRQTFGAATINGPGRTLLTCSPFGAGGVDVSGRVLVIGRLPGCAAASGVQVRNLASPSSPPTSVTTNSHELVALAGRYVAWSDRGFTGNSQEADAVTVVNWITGQTLYRAAVPGRISQIGVQSDGKAAIAYVPEVGDGLARLAWASSTGTLHVLAPRVDIVGGEVIIVDNRIAFPRALNDEDSTPAIASLTGRLLQRIRSDPLSTKVTDYDGSCLAWREDAPGFSNAQIMHVQRGPGRPARGSACA